MDEPNSIMEKLDLLERHISDLKSDNKTLSAQLGDIQNDNKKIEKQLSDIKADNKALLVRVNTLEKDKLDKDVMIQELQTKVSTLEEKADDQEQYSKRDNLLIQGLTMVKPFNKAAEPNNGNAPNVSSEQIEEDWTHRDRDIMKKNILAFATNKLKMNMDITDIQTVHTLKTNTPSRKGTCIVRFTNREARDQFFQRRSELYADPLQNRIYINEHLT